MRVCYRLIVWLDFQWEGIWRSNQVGSDAMDDLADIHKPSRYMNGVGVHAFSAAFYHHHATLISTVVEELSMNEQVKLIRFKIPESAIMWKDESQYVIEPDVYNSIMKER